MPKSFVGCAIVAFTVFTVPAHASVVFSDPFDSEPDGPDAGGSTLNDTGLTNWISVTNEGTVDTVVSGSFGIQCAGGAGKCIDLDGSTNNGGLILSKTLFSYKNGDLVTLTFDISGNQRNPNNDLWFGGFFNLDHPFYGNPPPIVGSSFFGNGPCGAFSGGAFSTRQGNVSSNNVCQTLGSAPWTSYSIGFRAANSGSFRLLLGDYSAGISDNKGALLDNVSLSIASVPEPATWAMMIMGFGLIGGAMRSARRTTVRFAAA
jgi:PEP-CTERM motif